MELLYISALSSERLINEIYEKTNANPGFAVQKFSRSLVRGLIQNGVKCTALSTPPVTRQFNKNLWISLDNETEKDVEYHYIPFINSPLLKHICIFFYSFFYVLKWGGRLTKEKAVICDVLCISLSLAVLLASKIIRLKAVAVVTDIYDQMVGKQSKGIRKLVRDVAGKLNNIYVRSFSMYVLLTEAMNTLVNPKGRPYIVMEALCEDEDNVINEKNVEKSFPRVILYAGGLEEKYGLKMLVEAFKRIDDPSCELHLYGSGSYASELIKETEIDARIKYWGVRKNEEILAAEARATLLVNPRFSTEEFTKYSFPSKNMEYMLSGTPLLTTKLPGMPKEYYPYVFLFEEELLIGYTNLLRRVLSYSYDKLNEIGRSAQKYVIENKNIIIQGKRILELMSK